MSTDALNPLSYVVLALVGDGGAGAHDLVRMMRQGGPVYWGGAPSRVYEEPKRLARLGYLTARRAPGRTRERTVFTLTPEGRRALVEHLAAPAPFPRIKDAAHLRLLAGDLLGDDAIRRSFAGMRAEIERLEALVEEMDRNAAQIPHRARYLRLIHAHGRRLLDLHRSWIAEVERELGRR